jgi:hypothetical protein
VGSAAQGAFRGRGVEKGEGRERRDMACEGNWWKEADQDNETRRASKSIWENSIEEIR